MNSISSDLKIMGKLFLGFLKWCIIALLVGGIVGVIGSLFHIGIEKATEIRTGYDWIILFLPLAGLFIVFIYKVMGMADDKGTNSILLAVRTNEKLTAKTAFLIFVTSIITHLFGGSAGREGAALQIGGSIASKLGRIIKLDEFDATIITMCGMSAGFGALFGTPVASAVFAMEVISVGIMHYSAIVPCVISSITGAAVASLFGIAPTSFSISLFPEMSVLSIIQVVGLSVLCAVISVIFCFLMRKSNGLFKKFLPNTYLRAFLGGLAIVLLTLIIGTRDYNGAGMSVIENAFTGDSRPEAFILKIVFTVITLSAGYKGGEIVPVFFIGAAFGNVASHFLGLPPSFGAGIGMLSMFCGVTNCPLASIFLSVELFGAKGIVFYAVAASVSYILSGYEGLYSEQKILYSKLKPRFIDKIIGKN